MSIEKSIVNKSMFYFRTQDASSKAGESLLQLVADGKLAETEVETEVVEGKTLVKRKAVPMDLAVPNVAALVVADALTEAQLAHMQAALTQYIEAKQRVEVEACTGKVVDWLELFGSAFTQKTVAVKVTAEQLKAAKAVMISALDGTVDGTAYAKPAGLKIVESMFDTRASITTCVKYSPSVLEKVQSIITTGTEVLLVADQLGSHADAIDLILSNIGKALAPKTAELDADEI